MSNLRAYRFKVGQAMLVLAVLGFAFTPPVHASSFLDKLNKVLKDLPKPTNEQTKEASGTQAGNTSAAQQSSAADASDIPFPPRIGTPEGTVDLIKVMPRLSAGSYYLGMPADKAVATLKKEGMLQSGFSRPRIAYTFSQLPNQVFEVGSFAEKQSGDHVEDIGLVYTTHPAKPVVVGIGRTVRYTSSEAPNVANTLSALREKYGADYVQGVGNQLLWFFDYKGHLLSRQQAAMLAKEGCAGGVVDVNDPRNGQGGKIAKGYDVAHGETANKACRSIIVIGAQLDMNRPGPSGGFGEAVFIFKDPEWTAHDNDLVQKLNVMILDVALDYSASTVSRDLVLNHGEQSRQEQIDSAKKNKPSL